MVLRGIFFQGGGNSRFSWGSKRTFSRGATLVNSYFTNSKLRGKHFSTKTWKKNIKFQNPASPIDAHAQKHTMLFVNTRRVNTSMTRQISFVKQANVDAALHMFGDNTKLNCGTGLCDVTVAVTQVISFDERHCLVQATACLLQPFPLSSLSRTDFITYVPSEGVQQHSASTEKLNEYRFIHNAFNHFAPKLEQ